ncbi:G1/S-specific cyclin Ccn1p [[Candida] jaroonii]|uniref:G1/S-specific cyclin Ccn1p n=1 Tax=[Candida] jaroonii TaxID=467808 RepID=A0ACA9Y1I9_9ASCO|nr:G1/S-specific cyclin Ccn1p [[Candida] jaroonii]
MMQVIGDRDGQVRRYGPPQCTRSRQYNPMLELLEIQGNASLFSEYAQDITNYSAILESSSSVNPSMIDLQPEIQWFMRPFLLDFLIELHGSFKLQPQTLFLSLNIVDRYCSKRIVFKRHYQLVGCTALWIAAKYEDKKSRVPTLKELSMMCRNAYDEDMFVQMEMHILGTLDWSLGHPNLEDCLQLSITACNISPALTPRKYNSNSKGSSTLSAVTAVGRFLCEISLYNKFFLTVPPSLVSFTANLLACSMLQVPNASAYLHTLINQEDKFTIPSEFDDDSENKSPDVKGPFLSGFEPNTIHIIRKICIIFVLQFSKITEVLSKKHEELGAVQVVNNFSNRFAHIIRMVHQNEDSIEEMPEEIFGSGTFAYLADALLQLSNVGATKVEQSPLTPPSASSRMSIFSGNPSEYIYETPMRLSNSSNYDRANGSTPTLGIMHDNWSSPVPSKTHI